jgi:small ligand-binding sensory domain FIST
VANCAGGLAVDADLVVAAEMATREALAGLADEQPDLAFVFACGADPEEVADALERAAELSGARTTVGCSAGGVIGGGRAVELTSAVSVWLGVLPGARLRSFHLEVLRTSESIAVLGLPPARGSDRAAVLLADPYSFPADAFVEQLSDALPSLPLSGGLANGLRGAGSTRLLVDGVVHDRGAVGVVIGESVRTETVVSQGCRPVGPVMTVTAADGNTVLGLAGMTALAKLEAIVADLPPDEQALVTTGLHLGMAIDEYADDYTRGDFLVRGVVGADAAAGALVVGDVVEVGRTVQFQVRDAQTADTDLTAALARFRRSRPADTPVDGALLFSCTGRGADLFTSADHDVRAVVEGLGAQGVAGFFAAGEIGPVGGRNHLHGYTASLLTFG